uniref:Uncharacterized protein n=1 Tax=Nelumbo nucifera TaxID=4432 RepID=A0A822YX55_NELNU|nr:TPA_asm: hypothetical protein HUJ06_006385 [Nelumbo nucifera]
MEEVSHSNLIIKTLSTSWLVMFQNNIRWNAVEQKKRKKEEKGPPNEQTRILKFSMGIGEPK